MLWVKAFHLIAVVTWFAAIFYLPRLFVYHAEAQDSISNERFKIMERKLYRGIMTPSMVAVIGLGFWLVSYSPSYYGQALWLQVKILLVGLLVIYHFWCGHLLKQFKDDSNQHSHVYYRWFNEIPVLLLVAIVILAIVKPWS